RRLIAVWWLGFEVQRPRDLFQERFRRAGKLDARRDLLRGLAQRVVELTETCRCRRQTQQAIAQIADEQDTFVGAPAKRDSAQCDVLAQLDVFGLAQFESFALAHFDPGQFCNKGGELARRGALRQLYFRVEHLQQRLWQKVHRSEEHTSELQS